ncbi:DUF5518 domain-containing protein [Halobaculum sp. MBLA0147]|uniref:DUF5518 domain-containing protein n=1 Tax=Halobaculum sp. MBLA0147 TaxID=3079934 RepID=UPI0035268160
MRRQIGVGAASIVMLSVVPVVGLIAPLLGGGFAGRYTDESPERGAVVGAGSGIVASILGLPLAIAASVAIAATSWTLAAAILVGTVGMALYTTGMSALGGYVGQLLTAEANESGIDSTVEQLRAEYLNDAVSETEFERRLEQALRDGDPSEAMQGDIDDVEQVETIDNRLEERP